MSRYRGVLPMVCLLVGVMTTPMLAANNNPDKITAQRISSDPYCGIYCLHTAIKLAGKESEIADLIKPEYVGSRQGSSLGELRQAAEDQGLEALVVGELTRRELLASPHSIILHVKASGQSKDYDHFQLFLGVKDGKARIFDPPNPTAEVAFRDLARRWGGTGLIVSDQPIDTGAIFGPTRKRVFFYSALVIVMVLLIRWIRGRLPLVTESLSRSKRLGLSGAQCGGVCLLAFIIGLSWHLFNDVGFLAHADATSSIQQAYQGSFIARVSVREVKGLISQGGAVIIDARRGLDYAAGHLDGAISIPVNSNDEQRKKATEGIAKETPIVVYCQSKGCVYDQAIAIKLMDEGFANVSIFKGGWVEWVAQNGQPDKEEAKL